MSDQSWFEQFIASPKFEFMKKRPIAYFCAEYALNDALPLYAGGLGILAGDMIREVADQRIPFIAVGLYYHRGYLYHDLYQEGIMMKVFDRINPAEAQLTLVVDNQKDPIIVNLPIQ